jgi:hypothetical protein
MKLTNSKECSRMDAIQPFKNHLTNYSLEESLGKLLLEGAQFFTDTGTNITKKIPVFATRITRCHREAAAIAWQKKSYAYAVYMAEKNSKREFYGYAIPN